MHQNPLRSANLIPRNRLRLIALSASLPPIGWLQWGTPLTHPPSLSGLAALGQLWGTRPAPTCLDLITCGRDEITPSLPQK